MSHRQALLALAAAPALLAGCSGSSSATQPKAGAFAAGPCRTAAGAVLDVGKLVGSVRDGSRKPAQVEAALTRDQDAIDAAAGPSALSALVREIGFFRISVDAKTYDHSRLDALESKQNAAVAACTGSPAPTP